MRKAGTVLIVAGLLALAACGEDREGSVEESGTGATATGTGTTGTSTAPKASGPVVATVDVRETEFELDPQNPRIAKPGVVQFDVTNAGKAPHALEVEGPEGEMETETIQPGGKATLKAGLSRAGSYVWYCPVGNHEAQGMKGRITVGGGGAGTTTDGSRTDDNSGGDDRPGRDDHRSGGDDSRGSGSGGGGDDSPKGREGSGGGGVSGY